MLDAASYLAREALRDGSSIEIRALRPDDRADLLSAISRASTQSLFRRFFAVRRNFTEKEIDRFIDIDFIEHVALVAVVHESGRPIIVGGGRYIITRQGEVEMAFVVIDPYQGRGIGSALLRHLIVIARSAGVQLLTADVLPDNSPMLSVFGRGGFCLCRTQDPQVVRVELMLTSQRTGAPERQ